MRSLMKKSNLMVMVQWPNALSVGWRVDSMKGTCNL